MANADIGMVGLGTMGSALALNIADNGYDVAVWDRNADVAAAFKSEAEGLDGAVYPSAELADFVASLKTPRAIIMLIPAGGPVDEMTQKLAPLLDPDDLLIDAGNANFHNTSRRAREADGYRTLGMGVSGGESGARHGPSIMGGGQKQDWDRIAPILNAVAAKFEGEPCARWMGIEGAGHFVKAVHNGIEYADMQMIAETYGVMRDGMAMDSAAVGDVFAQWDRGTLQSYLIEISGKVAAAIDPETGDPILDVIVDAAGQKGTGRWTAVEAQSLAAPVPAIEAAVVARNLSSQRDARAKGQALFGAAPQKFDSVTIGDLEQALIAGKVIAYAQGFEMIAKASVEFGWTLPLPDIARVWRAGCIIRSAMLDNMADAFSEDAERNLMFAPHFAELLKANHDGLRKVVAMGALNGIAMPALSSSLSYFDAMRTARGTANMIQGQRDYFGNHGFARFDGRTGQHGPWAAS